MATFTTYAEVITPDHPLMKMHAAGILENLPGQTIEFFLARSGGVYEAKVYIPRDMSERMRKLAELPSNGDLRAIADRYELTVSLDHLRHMDPKTRISVGCRLDAEQWESKHFGWKMEGPPDPKTTISYG